MKWFRLWTDIVDDVKMLQLSDYEFRIWIYLMAYLSDINSTSGHFQITFKLLSLHFHLRFNLFSRAIETFHRLGLITVDENGIGTVTNWNKRQFKSDNAYERVKKFRQVKQKRNVSNPLHETAPDTDTDKKKSNKRKTLIPDNFIISERVQEWAKTNGHNNLEAHLDSFKLKCRARGYRYIEWDAAFMEAIRENWAKIEAFSPERKKEGWV